MTEKDRPTVHIDLHSPEYAKNWRSVLESLHAKCPVAWSEAHGGFWIIAGHENTARAAKDWQTFSSHNELVGARRGIMIPPSPFQVSLNERDPPSHTRLRMLETPFFTPKYLQRWAPVAKGFIDEAIDAVIETGEVEFAYDIALNVTARTALYVVGIDSTEWRDWALPAHNAVRVPADDPGYPLAQLSDLSVRLVKLLTARRVEPKDDMITALAHATVDGEPLDDMVAAGMLQTLVIGGFDTAASLFLNAIEWLEGRHDVHAYLLADRAHMDSAIEEFLRVFPPNHGTARNITHDVDVGDQTLKAGERVILSWAGANFDPKKFECPFDVRLDRPNARDHLAFGGGNHRCLGAPLARIELQALFGAVLHRMPDYRIDHDRAERYDRIGAVNSWERMPARFTPGPRLGI